MGPSVYFTEEGPVTRAALDAICERLAAASGRSVHVVRGLVDEALVERPPLPEPGALARAFANAVPAEPPAPAAPRAHPFARYMR